MKEADYQSLINNKILKERSRLLILSFLISAEADSATFMELQKALDMTRGNLSVQITTLKDAGYVSVDKVFRDNKPQTTVTISKTGIAALKSYLSEMEKIIKNVNNQKIIPFILCYTF